MSKPKTIVSVTNDLSTDQRVDKICNTLTELGHDVILVGRYFNDSKFIYRNYETKRFQLWFNKGVFFYANYNIRLFFFLLHVKPEILWSNDLDTLPSNFIYSKIKMVKLIFDSHEYFTEVPELINRPFARGFWKTLERLMVPKLKHVLTVSQSIANLYEKEFKIKVSLLRNVPSLNKQTAVVKNIRVEGKKILIYQGAINVNRGIECMVESMLHLENTILYIVGSGDISKKIEALIIKLELQSKVIMLGSIPLENLHGYTLQADLGLSLEEDAGLNYRFALPNKLFDYVQAEIPVLVSNLPEMSSLVKEYQLGEIIDHHNSKHIAEKINLMLNNVSQIKTWKANAKKAALEFNWEKEQHVISNLF
jgi:glycosyltransferase involved in cell wall biosynthesis